MCVFCLYLVGLIVYSQCGQMLCSSCVQSVFKYLYLLGILVWMYNSSNWAFPLTSCYMDIDENTSCGAVLLFNILLNLIYNSSISPSHTLCQRYSIFLKYKYTKLCKTHTVTICDKVDLCNWNILNHMHVTMVLGQCTNMYYSTVWPKKLDVQLNNIIYDFVTVIFKSAIFLWYLRILLIFHINV